MNAERGLFGLKLESLAPEFALETPGNRQAIRPGRKRSGIGRCFVKCVQLFPDIQQERP